MIETTEDGKYIKRKLITTIEPFIDWPKSYIFNPKEDITTYELALCVKWILYRSWSDSPPEQIIRQFIYE